MMEVDSVSDKSNTGRRKFKKLCNKLRQQMEFYFSDSNLVKDKFLSNLISQDSDGYVDLSVFLTFNKVKALTDACDIIAAAVSRSSLFELSQDQKRVRRVTPINYNKDFDACTLYVEKLPPHADQKWVSDVFSHFGTIKYVNVPRFKTTGKVKGFAFVEFEVPESVKSACDFYKPASEKECTTSEDEGKTSKAGKKYKLGDSLEKKNRKGRSRTTSESSDKVVTPAKGNQSHHGTPGKSSENLGHKRKRSRIDSTNEETAVKKLKFELNNTSDKEVKPTSAIETNVDQSFEEMTVADVRLSLESGDGSQDSKQEMTLEAGNKIEIPKDSSIVMLNESELEDKSNSLDQSKSKKKRRNSKKHRSHHTDKPSLRVMPKSEWKMYRNKYLELQRSTMSLLKKQILFEMKELQEQENHSSKTSEIESPPKKSVSFQPGVILKLNLKIPVKNCSDFKKQVKAHAVVAYIDAPVDSSEVFLRCHSPEEAMQIIRDNKLEHLGAVELLKGDKETDYWDKIEQDKKNKYNSPVPHKKRGRDKLIAKAAKLEAMKNKHILFDE